MGADSYEGKALEAQALRDMEFMRGIDEQRNCCSREAAKGAVRKGPDDADYVCTDPDSGKWEKLEYTYREPKPEPYRLATASQLDWLRGLLPAIEGVRTLLKGGCGEQAAAALSFALGRIRDELEDGIDEIDGQRAK